MKHVLLAVVLGCLAGCGQSSTGTELGENGKTLSGMEQTRESPPDPIAPPIRCEELEYEDCAASSYCEPLLMPCPFVACPPEQPDCPVCSPSYQCVPKPPSRCQGLSERACASTPGCVNQYLEPVCPPCDNPALCGPCPSERFECVDDTFCGGGGEPTEPAPTPVPSTSVQP